MRVAIWTPMLSDGTQECHVFSSSNNHVLKGDVTTIANIPVAEIVRQVFESEKGIGVSSPMFESLTLRALDVDADPAGYFVIEVNVQRPPVGGYYVFDLMGQEIRPTIRVFGPGEEDEFDVYQESLYTSG